MNGLVAIQEADGKERMRTIGLPDMIMQALSLRLSFRHIRKIDNLHGFRCVAPHIHAPLLHA